MKSNSLKVNIWLYLIIFAVGIIVFLWLFQVIFIDKFYEYNKTIQIKETANQIVSSYQEDILEVFLDNLSYYSDSCIEITHQNYIIYSSNNFNKGCVTNTDSYKLDFINSNETSKTYEIINPQFENKAIIHAQRINETTVVFVNSSIEPLTNTVEILSKQLIIVSIIVLILAFVIGYYISNHISKPIVNINKKAKKLARGDYSVDFKINSSINEINELGDTLNYTKDELSKIDTLRRELLANVSHDLKTPLTMIKGYAEMIRDLTYKNKEKRNENLNTIIEETDRLNVLVNDILVLSKIQSKEELELEKFDLVKVIDHILKRYYIYKDTEGYDFIFESPKEAIIVADKKRLEQVIYNLVNNAINFTGQDNKILIKISDNKKTYRVEIIDTGKGINKEDLPFIWEKYYHSDNKHKRNVIGTGLGLSIVKNILEKHEFKYGVESQIKKGTTFYFEIEKNND